jgi:hypothetical protein
MKPNSIDELQQERRIVKLALKCKKLIRMLE